jgi:ribulose 1,5-bisphosphate synthetase/thiazole synthase
VHNQQLKKVHTCLFFIVFTNIINKKWNNCNLQELLIPILKKLKENLTVDVAIVGGGPSGIVASYFPILKKGKVAMYETKTCPEAVCGVAL